MGLKELVRADKDVVDWGAWKHDTKMPKSAFPLSKHRSFQVRASHRWRVVRFTCDGHSYRLLIAYRPELESYKAFLGRDEKGDTRVLARYEFHGTHAGWHLHSDCTGINVIGKTGLPDRIPGNAAHHRRVEFGIGSDEQALYVAAEKFGLLEAPLVAPP